MASRVDLVGIKQRIATLLSAANTTTGSPIDLSANLRAGVRVQKILNVHPDMVSPQASFYPLVTCYIQRKSPESADIAKSQLDAFRRATIEAHVVGAVWTPNITSATIDDADNDINYLMENVELILRSDPNFNMLVKWQYPSEIEYYSARFDHQTILRAGILKLNCEMFY